MPCQINDDILCVTYVRAYLTLQISSRIPTSTIDIPTCTPANTGIRCTKEVTVNLCDRSIQVA